LKLVPVVLAGGAGTRLWPLSREAYPKPFIRIQGMSLLARTYARATVLPDAASALTVINAEYVHAARDEFRTAGAGHADAHDGARGPSFLVEPFGRNTAPAVALAALAVAEQQGPEALLLVLPADHLIEDVAAFTHDVAAAVPLARDGTLVTFGIPPTHPETGYGYLECGTPLGGNACTVPCFVEKPDATRAAELVTSARYLWNAGMFLFTAQALLDGLRRHAPALRALAERCHATRTRDGECLRYAADAFAALPDISLDYALMEKADKVAAVRAGFDWNDIGSWRALVAQVPPDADGNRAEGEAVFVDSHNCFVQSADRVVAAVGVHDLLVVDTPDALLIADPAAAQQVREVAARLKQSGHPAHRLHRTVRRPWGSYTLIEQGPGYKLKRLEVAPGAALSLQLHHRRSEHWVVLAGTATVVRGDERMTIKPNESTFIPIGVRHRLANEGTELLVIVEVQTGDYVEEDDIVRFDDHYGRAT
jgi:mannose-1-phosphate guanylyltransferase/mannose-6-phosphate isomerase